MSWSDTKLEAPALERYTPFTPFESSYAFEPEAPPFSLDALGPGPTLTPFVSEYAGEPTGRELEAREMHEFLAELYDSELDEQLAELAQEAAAVATDRVGLFGEEAPGASAEQYLEEWLRPLREHADSLLDRVAEAVSQSDVQSMADSELDEFFERLAPRDSGLERYFEDFLGGLLKKAKSVVSGAVRLAKRGAAAAVRVIPGLRGLIQRLKGLVRPMLDRVLRMALDRLPPALRGPAQVLAQRVLGAAGVAPAAEPGVEAPAVPAIPALQEEFDLRLASLMFAGDEAEQEVLLADAADAREDESAPIAGLVQARARFIGELDAGEDPAEAMEQFIPAILPVARTVIGVLGRPSVVNYLARYLTRLIERHVGPQVAPQLSQAIVDTGLRLMTLEAPTEIQTRQLAPAAVAGTIEDTVRRLAELDEETLEHPALLEAAVQEAFTDAVAENFPPQLIVPEAREAAKAAGAWVFMPLDGSRKYYKKYTSVLDVELSQQTAEAVTSFGGVTLAAFLRAQLTVTPPVRARVHLYQAVPGTWLSRIARHEKSVPGLGTSAKSAWSQLHPLTPGAAAALLGEPKLGRASSLAYLDGRDLIAVGQRFYFLEIAGARAAAAKDGAPVARAGKVNITLDFPRDEFRVAVFLSETDAQEIAAHLRRRELGGALTLAKRAYESMLRSAMHGDLRRHVRIRTETSAPDQLRGGALRVVAKPVLDALAARFVEWVGRGIGEYLSSNGAEFISASEDRADGVTVVVTIAGVPGSGVLRRLLRGDGPGAAALADPRTMFAGSPRSAVRIVPGFRDA